MKPALFRRWKARQALDMGLSRALAEVQRYNKRKSSRQVSHDEVKRRLLARAT